MTFTTTYRAFSRFLAAVTIGALIASLVPAATFAQEPADEETLETQSHIETDLDFEADIFDDTGTTSPDDLVDDILSAIDLPFTFGTFDDFLDEFDISDFPDFDQAFCTEESFESEFLSEFPDFEDVLNDFPDDIFDFLCDIDLPDPDPEPQDEVVVHIYKYLEDDEDEIALATEGSFEMTATWQADNLNNGSSTSGTFTLHSGNGWHAVTSVMDAGADYTTSEVANDDVLGIGATCTEDNYRLVGYQTGNSLSAAQNASLSTSTPDFDNLTNDKYVIVVNEDCDDVLNPDPDPDPTPEMCSIWSDESTLTGTSTPAVNTFVHGSWTTEFNAGNAEWLWSTATVTDPTVEETVTFTKTFTASATTSDAELTVAADNYYTATLNGNPVGCIGATGDNHSSADTCTVSLQNGTNTLQFEVTNEAGDQNPEVNPAGLIFELSWEADDCEVNQNPDPDPEPTMCTLEIVSDASNRIGGGQFAVLVGTVADAWDAVVDGARWIWGMDPLADAVNETSETFTKSFNWGGDLADIDSATLTIASDNTYAVTLNGSTTASSTATDNFSNETEYDVTDLIETGTNDLSIAVTNFAEASGTPESNPAGLLYKLTVVGGNNNCVADGGNDTSDEDTYIVYGYVWNDEDDDELFEEGDENGIEGHSVSATNGSSTISDTTDASGYYELELPEGTWTVSQVDTDSWDQTTSSENAEEAYPVNGDGDYVITLGNDEEEVAAAFPFNLFVHVAAAAVIDTLGPLSFGLSAADNGGGGGGGGGGGSSRRSSNNDDDDDDDDDGEVLGAQTSVIPFGGANAGGGATSVTIPSMQQLLARPEKFLRISSK